LKEEKIFDWAEKVGFVIDGDALDKEFAIWEEREEIV